MMTQEDVYKFLESNKERWFTTKEIAKNIGISIGSVCNNIGKLLKGNFILERKRWIKNNGRPAIREVSYLDHLRR